MKLSERISVALGDNIFTRTSQSLEEVVADNLIEKRRDNFHSGKLHRRIARRAAHANFWQLELFSRRRGELQQRIENRVGWRARRADRRARRCERRSCRRACGRNSPRDRQHPRSWNYRRCWARQVARPKNRLGLCTSRLHSMALRARRAAHFPGDRDRVRWQASQIALDMVRRHFLEAARTRQA